MDDTETMYRAVASYLEKQGWNALVMSSPRIQRPASPYALSAVPEAEFEFVVRFTGGKLPDPAPKKSRATARKPPASDRAGHPQ
jgi:hypothetical protein